MNILVTKVQIKEFYHLNILSNSMLYLFIVTRNMILMPYPHKQETLKTS